MNETRAIARPRPPSVDRVLRSPPGEIAAARFGRRATVDAIRKTLAELRDNLANGAVVATEPVIAEAALRRLEREDAPSLKRVFNLTGTVLHTNLGRALLPECAIAAAAAAMRHPVALEFDLGGGARGERDDHVRGLIRELTGAEDAAVVNNNAGAVLLALNTFAAARDAIVSRGELIEIGGSFRLPDIMLRAGARLVEVGTTNRTHLDDYANAIGENTGLVLKAHTSNYLIQGFTKSVSTAELSRLARSRRVPLVHDLGSGSLLDLSRYGLAREPTVREALADGADLVTFSTDKLLGGPQAGIIAGSKGLVARVARNPMKRALRVDKIRIAALEAVLKLYRDPDRLPEALPTLRDLVRSRVEIAGVAARVRERIAGVLGASFTVSLCDCSSQIGSGAAPLETLPSAGIAIAAAAKGARRGAEALAASFRRLPIPVIGRLKDGALIFDLRCLDDEAGFTTQLDRLQSSSEAAP